MKRKTEITLPIELANLHLDLDDIGAIFVLMCIPHMDDAEKAEWVKDEDFMYIINDLMNEEIVKSSEIDGELTVEIDLSFE